MYFKDRREAGQKLANRFKVYIGQPTVVVALSDGGILVGQEIANKLGGLVTLMLSRDITLPGEISVLGTVDQSGGLTYNSMFSVGEIEEYVGEFYNYIESQKMNKSSEINHLLGRNGLVNREMLNDKVIILVTDGARNGSAFDAAMNFLKPVRYKKLITAAPLASVSAIDRMHVIGDAIEVLSVVDNFMDTDHYYTDNKIPSSEELMNSLSNQPVNTESKVDNTTGRQYN